MGRKKGGNCICPHIKIRERGVGREVGCENNSSKEKDG